MIQVREHMLPRPPEGLAPRDRDNFVRHFRERDQAEARYFGDQARPSCKILEVAPEDLNTERSAEFIRSLAPDLVLVFGCGLIKEPLAGLGPEGHGQELPLHRLQGRAPADDLRSFRQRPGGPLPGRPGLLAPAQAQAAVLREASRAPQDSLPSAPDDLRQGPRSGPGASVGAGEAEVRAADPGTLLDRPQAGPEGGSGPGPRAVRPGPAGDRDGGPVRLWADPWTGRRWRRWCA